MPAVPATGWIITCEYDPTGLAWCIVHDNRLIAWLVDDSGPSGTPVEPKILGTLPGDAPKSGEVLSPSWASLEIDTVFVPNVWRGLAMHFLEWLATNNGANRPLYAVFASQNMQAAWTGFAANYPHLALDHPPNVPVKAAEPEAKPEPESKLPPEPEPEPDKEEPHRRRR